MRNRITIATKDKPISIYCLIDPRDNKPFYVGATVSNIHNRLSAHFSEVKNTLPQYWNAKVRFMNEISQLGKKPRVRLLQVVNINDVDYYEEFFYKMFVAQGFSLLQLNYAFYYKNKITNLRELKPENQQIKKYNIIMWKTLIIIIW